YKTGIITIPALLLSTQLQAVTLGFFPSTANVTPGSPFSVDLRISDIDANTAIGDYDFDINFDSSLLSIATDDVVFGNQLQQAGVDSFRSVSVVSGQLNISEVSLNDAAVLNAMQSDEFTVATLNFTAEEDTPGSGQLGLTVNALGNQAGSPVASTVNPPIRVSGLTSLQSESARVLDNVSAGFNANQGVLSDNQQELAAISSLLSGDTGLSSEALSSAYQNIAGEETTAPANMALKSVISQSQLLRTQLANRRNSNRNEASGPNLSALQNNGYLTLAALGVEGIADDSVSDDDSLASTERLGGFIDATANFGETDQTDREDATHFNKEEVTLGVDYQFTDQFVSGLAVTYSNANANFQKSINVSGGKAAEEGYSGSIYSTYYLDDFYVDGIFTYTKRDYDIERNIVIPSQSLRRQAKADTESDQYAASLGLGHNLQLQGFDLNPFAQVSYTRLEIDGYNESGAGGLNLNVDNQDVESLESVLGARLAYAWSHAYGVLMPQFRAEWHHEFKENSRTINTSFVNDINSNQNVMQIRSDAPDRDFAIIGIGLSGVFQGGLQVFGAFETLLAQQDTSSHKFTAGLRLAF
ncbi:MAG: autotransporter domain-containing protein, partial [Methylococcales bacterium]